ncbi:undecaprenyl-diphosphatase [Psychrilyobacter sp.]|uniref:undecaprenyl-diphosphatase n=1 Tax=Psychrilyobacter sp. TaxID=2586924 RepID=UPI0030159457
MESLNRWLFLSVNNFAGKNDILDRIGVFLGEQGPYFFIGLIVYIYIKRQNKKEAIYATITMISAILLNHLVGLFYLHPRPFVDGLGVILKEHTADSSFPSDHTTFMLALSWSLTMFKGTKKIGKNMLMLGIILGFFRVFEGVHYPFDILGALVMGYFNAHMIYRSKERLKPLIDLILKIDNKVFKKD